MTAVRFTLLTVETDSADPVIMAALRELLERAGAGSVLVAPVPAVPAPVAATPAAPPVPLAEETSPPSVEAPQPKRMGRPPGSKNHQPIADAPAPAPRLACLLFPPCRNCRDGDGECLGIVKSLVVLKPEPEIARPAPVAPTPLNVGHVSGVAAPAQPPGSLTDRIVQAVIAKPGTTQHELAVELLGSGTSANVRRIDMLLGPLVMSSKLARYNGRIYESVAQAGKLKLPPPGQHAGKRRLGDGAAPLAQVQTQKELFDKIVAAFAEDHAVPVPDLARELFGESTGRAVDKLHLMLRQLCSSKRLKSLGANSYRPFGEDERAATEETEDDDETEEDSDDEKQELVSNGHPDDEEPQELEVG